MFKRYDKFLSGGFFLLIAAIVFSQISAIRMKDIALNSRLMPVIIAIGLAIIGVALLIQGALEMSSQSKENRRPVTVDKTAVLRVCLCFLLFVFLAASLSKLGFILSASIYLLATILVLCPKTKRTPRGLLLYLIFSVGFSTVVYYLFVNVFYIMLPYGSIWPR